MEVSRGPSVSQVIIIYTYHIVIYNVYLHILHCEIYIGFFLAGLVLELMLVRQALYTQAVFPTLVIFLIIPFYSFQIILYWT
jgi:hypothetical protein